MRPRYSGLLWSSHIGLESHLQLRMLQRKKKNRGRQSGAGGYQHMGCMTQRIHTTFVGQLEALSLDIQCHGALRART